MPKSRRAVSWVVYQVSIDGKTAGRNAVCSQAEWDALELAKPGQHVVVHSSIASEAEAERLARGTSGDPTPRTPRRS